MSRLFDALKEASRFRENNDDGSVGGGIWKALGLPATEEPPYPERAEPSGVVPATPRSAWTEVARPAALESVSLGIPTTLALDSKARLLPNAMNPMVIERYRMLRTKILQQREIEPFRSLLLTSSNPQEGKTVTTLNLALSFASLPSFKVLLVDGDMRRGSLSSWLGVDDERSGLSNLIDGSANLADVVLKSQELPMDVIARGNSQPHDLVSSRFAIHFREMTEHYDLVLVDSPPVNLITDVQLLAAACDAVLLITRAFSTNRKALEEAVHHLQPFRVIGTVLNAGEAKPSYRYSGYYK